MENDLEKRIKAIEERNKKVELNKGWETSFIRIFTISLITYIVAVVLLNTLSAPKPFLNALAPVIGFILSTWSIPFIKGIWLKNK